MTRQVTEFSPVNADAVSFRGRPRGQPLTVNGRLIESYESISDWWAAFKHSPSYEKSSNTYLTEYCQYTSKDPDSLIAERKSRLKQDPDDRTDEKLLNRWHQKLLERHAPGFALAKYTAIVSFFRYNNKPLNIPRFPTVDPGERKEFRRLRKEEIQRLIGRFGSRFRPRNVVIVGAETGLRIQHLRILRLRHLVTLEDGSKEGVHANQWRDLVDLKPPVRISLPKRCYFGTKKAGITYVCGDAVKGIVEDLKDREARGEPIGPDTPLFPVYMTTVRSQVSNGQGRITYFAEWQQPGTPVMLRSPGPGSRNGKLIEGIVEKVTVDCASESTLQYDMRVLRDRARIPVNEEEERPVSIHSLRKYLRSTLDASVASSVMVNVIIGHSNAVEEHYSGARHLQLEEIRVVYESAMQRIAVTEDIDRPKMQVMESKIKNLEERNGDLEGFKAELSDLKEKMRQQQRDNARTIRLYEQLLRQQRRP